ncbi:unnamed protein product [Periconia digitata]|uniref:Uncharacterized protein n=1 Tax=Periconia digitata TaxID=1303443 RepID=A0A9W4U8A7_9PLEO|nr:unnamed protein product [Periconia digitata]
MKETSRGHGSPYPPFLLRPSFRPSCLTNPIEEEKKKEVEVEENSKTVKKKKEGESSLPLFFEAVVEISKARQNKTLPPVMVSFLRHYFLAPSLPFHPKRRHFSGYIDCSRKGTIPLKNKPEARDQPTR